MESPIKIIELNHVETIALIPLPTNPSKQVTVYSQTETIKGISRTTTTVEWNPNTNQWEVKQHFPNTKGWDQATQSYDPSIPPYAYVNLP